MFLTRSWRQNMKTVEVIAFLRWARNFANTYLCTYRQFRVFIIEAHMLMPIYRTIITSDPFYSHTLSLHFDYFYTCLRLIIKNMSLFFKMAKITSYILKLNIFTTEVRVIFKHSG